MQLVKFQFRGFSQKGPRWYRAGICRDLTRPPPTRCCLQPRLPVMASVAPGSQVVQLQPEVWPNGNRNLVVGVEVSLSPLQPLPQFVQDLPNRRVAQLEASAVRHGLRFPPAIHTSPLVSLEAKDPELSVVGVIATRCRRSALFIPLPPCLPSVVRAVRLPIAKCLAPRRLARLSGRTGHQPSPSRPARVAPGSAHVAAGSQNWHCSARW